MATKEHAVEQLLLLNKQLKERNDNLTSEQEAFYQLRCKHRVERDQLSFDRITDLSRHRKLLTQQTEEMDQLKRQNTEIRLALQERHATEKNNSKQAI